MGRIIQGVMAKGGNVRLGNLSWHSKVEFMRWWGEPVTWRVIGRDLTGMPEGSVTLLSERLIAVIPFDAREPDNPDEGRSKYGNTDWSVSNLRQWLNSDANAGQWYSAQHEYDTPPIAANLLSGYNPYESWVGFLNGATAEEKSALMETERRFMSYEGGRSGTSRDRVFLLTSTELGREDKEYEGFDGTAIPYFKDVETTTIACLTALAIEKAEWVAHDATTDEGWRYYTSSQQRNVSYNVGLVTETGAFQFVNTYTGYVGVRPAVNLPRSLPVSDFEDESGRYVIGFDGSSTSSVSYLGTSDGDGVGWYDRFGDMATALTSDGEWAETS